MLTRERERAQRTALLRLGLFHLSGVSGVRCPACGVRGPVSGTSGTVVRSGACREEDGRRMYGA